jgi:hypothetical protein
MDPVLTALLEYGWPGVVIAGSLFVLVALIKARYRIKLELGPKD